MAWDGASITDTNLQLRSPHLADLCKPVQPSARAQGQSWAHATDLEQGIIKSDTRPRLVSKEYLILQAANASDLPLTATEVEHPLL